MKSADLCGAQISLPTRVHRGMGYAFGRSVVKSVVYMHLEMSSMRGSVGPEISRLANYCKKKAWL